jgi:hypothetical protein
LKDRRRLGDDEGEGWDLDPRDVPPGPPSGVEVGPSQGASDDVQSLASHLPWYLPLILLSVALVIGLVMARRVWEETHEDVEPATEQELLREFERAYAAGELEKSEMQRVQELLRRPRLADTGPTIRVPGAESGPPEEGPESPPSNEAEPDGPEAG